MRRNEICVYNHTNECFLSLGATLGDHPLARLKQWLGVGRRRADEGYWISPYEQRRALTLFLTRDLVYLDAMHRVVHVVESFSALRVIPAREDAVTLLALPVHTISSSQTKPGNQLVVCAADEMEHRLRNLFQAHSTQEQPPRPHVKRKHALPHSDPGEQVMGAARDAAAAPVSGRRKAEPIGSPVAYYADGGKLAVHAIRDLNATGLFLVTRDRWPIGAEVKMSLQPSGRINDETTGPITVRMRVTRWGADGVGLEFAGAAAEASELKSLYVC